jgi:hypothetical protein
MLELTQALVSLGRGKYRGNKNILHFRESSFKMSAGTGISARIDGDETLMQTSFSVCMQEKKQKVLSFSDSGAEVSGGSFRFSEIMNAAGGLVEIIKDMPRHNALEYINKNAIPEDFYKAAEAALDDGYIYLILSDTGSAAGQFIRSVTKKDYGHVSISLDEKLDTVLSYNGGDSLFSPGMNHEELQFFYKKEDANLLIYKVKATVEQKRTALDEIKKIDSEGSSYNLIGLMLPYSHRENIMFCSQFVYHILKKAGLAYFEKEIHNVRPMDFIEMDLRRDLEFHSQLYLKDAIR